MKFSSFTVGAVLAGGASGFTFVPPPPPIVINLSSMTVSSSETQPSFLGIDKTILKSLDQETRAAEKEAELDKRRVNLERSKEAFFDYEAKMAAETEQRIEAAEKKALLEATKDKQEAEQLKLAEEKAEKEAALAQSKKEKALKQKEARVSMIVL